jgi:hypothetical protein
MSQKKRHHYNHINIYVSTREAITSCLRRRGIITITSTLIRLDERGDNMSQKKRHLSTITSTRLPRETITTCLDERGITTTRLQ